MRRKIKIDYFSGWGHHRFGWDKILDLLQERLGSEDGTPVIGAVEQYFNSGMMMNDNWVGFIHWCPDIPEYVDSLYGQGPYDLKEALQNRNFRDALHKCQGLFVFSDYLRQWLNNRLDVPIETVLYPVGDVGRYFSFDSYIKSPNPSVIMIGHWLRVFRSIFELPTKTMEKIWLRGDTTLAWEKCIEVSGGYSPVGKTFVPDYVNDDEFDELLCTNLGFSQFYSSSANNAVVDCLARQTPLLVNRLDAIVEYLGDDYPFYFQSLQEAAKKAESIELVYQAHQHMKLNPTQNKISIDYFIHSVQNSEIYKSL